MYNIHFSIYIGEWHKNNWKVDIIKDKIIDNPVIASSRKYLQGCETWVWPQVTHLAPSVFLVFFFFLIFSSPLSSYLEHYTPNANRLRKKKKKRNKYHSIVFKRVLNLISVRLGCHCGSIQGLKEAFFQYIFLSTVLRTLDWIKTQ